MLGTISYLQLLLALVAIYFLTSGLLKFVKRVKSMTFFKLFATLIIWGSVLFFALFPRLAKQTSVALGLGENLNTLIFIGFVLVFIVIFRLIAVIERIDRNISEIVRKEALKKIIK